MGNRARELERRAECDLLIGGAKRPAGRDCLAELDGCVEGELRGSKVIGKLADGGIAPLDQREQLAHVKDRLTPRKYRRPRKMMLGHVKQVVVVSLSRDFLREMGRRGAAARAAKLSGRRRRQIARKAARMRWSAPKLIEVTARP